MTPVKKAATKKKVAKKKAVTKAAAPAAKKIAAISTPYTKTQLYAHISEKTGVSRKDVGLVFDSLADVIEGHVKSRGAGECCHPNRSHGIPHHDC